MARNAEPGAPGDHSYCHRGGAEPLLGRTIPEHFERVVREYGARSAAVFAHRNVRYTHAELDALVRRTSRALLARNLSRGDHVGVWATDHPEWLILQFATARLGIVLVNVNPAYRAPELDYAVRHSQVKALFLMPTFRSSRYLDMLLELYPELRSAAPGRSVGGGRLELVVLFDPSRALETQSPARGVLPWQDFLASGDSVGDSQVLEVARTLDPDDTINIQYTSGTTGRPKAVMLSHHNILNNAYFSAQLMRFGPEDRLCVPVPFYHCFGMVLANLLALSVGGSIVVPAEHFDPGAVLQAVQAERCTTLHGVPTMFVAELEHERFGDYDLSSLRTGIMAGAPCPPDLMRRVMEEMYCREILIGYGQTEASPLTHLTRADDDIVRRTQTVGTNLPHQEVKIVAPETGRVVPRGTQGEVCFRGYHVMQGYFGDPEATARVLDRTGWLHSGDLGTMDGDGYVRITGRLKDMIIRGGENIYPAEIEAVLFEHPAVAQSAVFGLPDERYGERVFAWVQLHPHAEASSEDLRAFCRERMAHFKVPEAFRVMEEFPMTVTGKLQKFRIREMEAALRSPLIPGRVER